MNVKQNLVLAYLIILLFCVACQITSVPNDSDSLPTLAILPSAIPTNRFPEVTFTPRATSTNTITPVPTATDEPFFTPPPAIGSVILLPSWTPTSSQPLITRTPLPETFLFGKSAQGRDLLAYRFGTGDRWILLVGGIHAGFESNTIVLMERLIEYWRSTPHEILPTISFIIVPRLNPDGIEQGRVLAGRFNGNGVDLNRNWACGWTETAEFNNQSVDPGFAPFDQPESAALASLIQTIQPSAVMFYHAAANGVFAGNCGDNPSLSSPLEEVYGTASGYPYGEVFGAYRVSGSAPAWVNSMGIPAIDVELASADLPEFDRNLRAIQAVQRWIGAQ